MIAFFAILLFSVVSGAPTTNNTSTSIALTTTNVPPTKPHIVIASSTDLSNETDTEYVGIRGSIEREIAHLRTSYHNMREDIDDWMSTPYHRNVVIPVFVGVISAFGTILFYCLAKAAYRNCVRRFRRCRLSKISCDMSGDKKRMLPKRNDSDDDDI